MKPLLFVIALLALACSKTNTVDLTSAKTIAQMDVANSTIIGDSSSHNITLNVLDNRLDSITFKKITWINGAFAIRQKTFLPATTKATLPILDKTKESWTASFHIDGKEYPTGTFKIIVY